MENKFFKVKSETDVKDLAGAIANTINENNKSEIQAIGAGAVNQAVKAIAIAIARSFVAAKGVNLVCIPAFTTVQGENGEITGIKFIVKEEK